MRKCLLFGLLLGISSGVFAQTYTVTTITSTTAGNVVDGAIIAESTWKNPMRMVYDADSNLIVVARGNHCIMKVDFTNDKASIVAGAGTTSTSGYLDDVDPLNATFNGIYGVALDATGNIYVGDRNNARIRKIEKLTSGGYGAVTTIAGNGTMASTDNDDPLQASFNYIGDIAINAAGDIFVLDAGGSGTAGNANNNKIRKISGTTGKVTTLVDTFTGLSKLFALAVDTDDNLIFGDDDQVFKVDVNTGAVSVIAGIAGTTGTTDGTLSNATFYGITGLTVHKATGDIYVSAYRNALIRKIDRTNNTVSTLAGTGSGGAAGATGVPVSGDDAQFATPTGIAVNKDATVIYIGDTNNSTIRRIDKVTVTPVTLTSFNAKAENNGVELTWTTTSEQNNSHFEVLRSENGTDFNTIATVAGNGNSNTKKHYSYTDKSSFSETVYYQLRQVDYNGKSELSAVRAVKAGLQESQLAVYTAIDHTSVKVFAYSEAGGNAVLKITDMQGKIVYSGNINLVKGHSEVSLALALETGLYVATLQTGTENRVTKFVAQ